MTANQAVTATFALKQWTLTASAGSNGTISPSGAVVVDHGTSQTFTITPDLHYHVADVLVDGVSVGAVTTYTFSNVTANHTIAASFAQTVRNLTVNVVGTGSVTKNPNLAQYPEGSVVSLTATPGATLSFVGWSGDANGSANPLALTMDADKVVTATFADTTRPAALVQAPNGGQSVVVGTVVQLKWRATDDIAVAGVRLLLSRHGLAGPWDSLTTWIPNSGTMNWTTNGPTTPFAMLKVQARDAAGNMGEDVSDATFTILGTTGVARLEGGPPAVLTLAPVRPNPMREQARIGFGLPVPARVRLAILDLQGREVAVIADDEMPAGMFAMDWDGRSANRAVPAGMYFVRLQVGGRQLVRRLMLRH
ncbi:MAG: T9SS type A sorting domain-containing protein [Candidatus Eisenbacteria bacterium]|uniref:T9SS type A sorting domain-containing protein n=1 Tax=Eiseniibacteriota bacterium TaxID=2212470 RepID=A0A538U828_UNCEI|nr:MAG: T9SS type A sorting domain-containing protein [Candidatus Eisenbacteria bacterium]